MRPALQRSLSVLLPVHNAQSTLADMVADLLEFASDWTHKFELLIIDDGSTDATSEVAHELSRCYPQIRAIRHATRMGRETAIRTGLEQSVGEMVFVRDSSGANLERLHRTSKPSRPNYLGRTRQTV